jgi:uncharacterized membrane protein YoaK (UPF0700 family)
VAKINSNAFVFSMLSSYALALVLIAVAGWVDAVGFLQLGDLFVSFMSGNTTQLAVRLAAGPWVAVAEAALVIFTFVVGVFVGTLIGYAAGSKRLPVVLLVEAAVLSCALFFPPARHGTFSFAALPMTLAMGLQNAAMNRIGQQAVSLTYITGTLVRCARQLAAAVTKRGDPWNWLDDWLLWLSMTIGAVCGALAFAALGLRALLPPIIVVVIFGVAEFTSSHQESTNGS